MKRGGCFTFYPDNSVEKIDYIFLSKDINVEKIVVPEEIGSDHRAYLCEVKFL